MGIKLHYGVILNKWLHNQLQVSFEIFSPLLKSFLSFLIWFCYYFSLFCKLLLRASINSQLHHLCQSFSRSEYWIIHANLKSPHFYHFIKRFLTLFSSLRFSLTSHFIAFSTAKTCRSIRVNMFYHGRHNLTLQNVSKWQNVKNKMLGSYIHPRWSKLLTEEVSPSKVEIWHLFHSIDKNFTWES